MELIKYSQQDIFSNFCYFVEHHKELSKLYKNKYLVIRNKNIVDAYDAEDEARKCAAQMFPNNDFSVYLCTGDKSDYMVEITTCWVLE